VLFQFKHAKLRKKALKKKKVRRTRGIFGEPESPPRGQWRVKNLPGKKGQKGEFWFSFGSEQLEPTTLWGEIPRGLKTKMQKKSVLVFHEGPN